MKQKKFQKKSLLDKNNLEKTIYEYQLDTKKLNIMIKEKINKQQVLNIKYESQYEENIKRYNDAHSIIEQLEFELKEARNKNLT